MSCETSANWKKNSWDAKMQGEQVDTIHKVGLVPNFIGQGPEAEKKNCSKFLPPTSVSPGISSGAEIT